MIMNMTGHTQKPSNVYLEYQTEHGTAPETKKFAYGYTLTVDDLPELESEDFNFMGWWNQDFTLQYTIGFQITTNITMYAKWIAKPEYYGVYWEGTANPAMTRTGLSADFTEPIPYVNNGMTGEDCYSPFDNLMPWSGIERVTDSEAGELVKIPKYWFRWVREGDSMELQISDHAQDGFSVSPSHADRGDGFGERDFIYVGRYHCSEVDYKSTSGVKPKASITRATARNEISNLGASIWQIDYAMFWTINMLYLVEYADWDSQVMIGYGCGGTTPSNSGKTDSMPYHTGTMQNANTTYGTGIQYRYIEDWWANLYDWIDGIRLQVYKTYIIDNPIDFSDTAGGTNVGTINEKGYYIKKWSALPEKPWAIIPIDTSVNIGYVCDYSYILQNNTIIYFGGSGNYDINGAFYMHSAGSNSSYVTVGCRLQKLP